MWQRIPAVAITWQARSSEITWCVLLTVVPTFCDALTGSCCNVAPLAGTGADRRRAAPDTRTRAADYTSCRVTHAEPGRASAVSVKGRSPRRDAFDAGVRQKKEEVLFTSTGAQLGGVTRVRTFVFKGSCRRAVTGSGPSQVLARQRVLIWENNELCPSMISIHQTPRGFEGQVACPIRGVHRAARVQSDTREAGLSRL